MNNNIYNYNYTLFPPEETEERANALFGPPQPAVPAAAAPAAVVPATAVTGTAALREVTIVREDQAYKDELVNTRIRCSICLTNEKNTRLNCGHLICSECAATPSLQRCPECRTRITSREDIYFKKYLKYRNKYLSLKNNLN
jgi:hypothetical protein